MANLYADTILLEARAFIKDINNKKFQTRPTFTKILEMFMRDREFTIPNLATLRRAETQPTFALYLNNKDFTLQTDKTCAPTGEQSGSTKVAVNWQSLGFEIKTSFKQHAGNDVAQQRAFANDLWNAEKSLWFGATGIDSILLAFLEAQKSDVNAGSIGTFDAANDIMAILAADEDDFYNIVTAEMQMNNYSPIFMDAFDTAWTRSQRRFANQGAANSTNLAFQFDGFDFMPSNLIIPGVIGANTYKNIHYIVPEGGVAIIDWNDPLNVGGATVGDKTWSTAQSLLFPDFTYDVLKTSGCADTTADGGGKQDLVDVWAFTLNFSPQVQPTPTGSPIFKYGNIA